ncbi:hypothetical protein EB796_005186 [Bugula neritina]|uniref:Uncharacterized protein n=1 Tax=Bugula neritina TaxID=10212 RepID=A0A7J7KCW9_BUGNE|nr:hypothetical protein EB796_005186 [Bugula neritina]
MKGPEIRFPITIEGRHKAKNSNDAQTEGEKEANDGEKEANADESTKPEDVGVEVADEPEEINSPAS